MHIINYIQAKEVFENSRKRKLANNTYLEKDSIGDFYAVRLHSTRIICYYPNRTVLNTGGWKTLTTKERMNEFTPFTIWQEQGIWYIANRTSEGCNKNTALVFEDGCFYSYKSDTWQNCGENPKAMLKLRKKVRQYAKGFAKAFFEGKVPKPSAGDCFYCSMQDVKTGKSLGEVTKDKDHILNHLIEKYYVPSLLVNAINAFSVSIAAKGMIHNVWFESEQVKNCWPKGIVQEQIESSIKRYCYRQLGTAS